MLYLLLVGFTTSISLAQTSDCGALPSPAIDVEVDIVGVDYPSSGTCGHFNALIDITITNTGSVRVDHILATMDLATDFGVIFEGKVAGPAYLAGDIPSGSLNGSFTGEGANTQLIADEFAGLDVNAYSKIRVEVELAPDRSPEIAATTLARVIAQAQADHANSALVCPTPSSEDSEPLGDCWQKSRIAAANDQINITLNACTALITPDMVLENHFAECDSDTYPEGGFYRLQLIGPNDEILDEGPTVTAEDPGLFADGRAIVRIENVGYSCRHLWGYVQLEDKTGAVVADCPSEVYTACVEKEVQKISGTIPAYDDVSEEVVNFGAYSCFIEDGRLPSCDRTYDLVPFQVDKTDIYTFELSMEENPGLMAIYQGSFDREHPCENIIGQSDVTVFAEAIFPTDDRLEARIRMVFPMEEGVTYYLLTTHAQCEEEEEEYSYTIYGDNGGKLAGITPQTEKICYTLLCDDVPYIMNKPESVDYLPSPIFTDNCTSQTDLDVRFEDQLFEEGDCGGLYIVRTWTARDEAGNEEAVCEQTIYFRRPTLSDVYKPTRTVPIDCDEMFPTLPNGNPHPDHTGYPYVVSAFGIHDLKESFCNVGADYTDIARIDVCDNSYKIVRQWTLVDWCDIGDQDQLNNDPLNNFRQVLKVGDFNPPRVECPEGSLDFVTGPFDCTASIPLLPPRVSDDCPNGWTVQVQILTTKYTAVYDRYGTFLYNKEEEEVLAEGVVGDYAGDIPVGTHTLRYIVTDNCGNQTIKDCPISVRDDVNPAPICNEDLQISIGSTGIAQVAARDIDEGSWDNCTPVGLKVSRSFETEACRDQYLQEILQIEFSDLEKITVTGPDGETAIYVDEETKTDTILRQKGAEYLTWWEEEVFFTCCDINQQVTVEMLAVDGDGTVSSYWAGNNNGSFCWMELTVEDKIAPTCIPPVDVEKLCTELPYGFDASDTTQLQTLFGMAMGDDNCPGWTVRELTPEPDLNCGFGTIIRTFEVIDAQGKVSIGDCKQTIEIREQHAYEIKFPKDETFYCGESPMPDTAVYTELACDLLTINTKDEFFEGFGEECYKIFRTYRIINWCEYDGESDPLHVERDEDCDGKGGNKDVWVLVRANGKVYFDQDNDENNGTPAAGTKGVNCEELTNPAGHWINSDIAPSASPSRDITSNGFWQYTQIIKVVDTTTPEVTINRNEPFCVSTPNNCTAEVFIPFTVDETCYHYRYYDVQVFFDEFSDKKNLINVSSRGLINRDPKYTIIGEYPVGKHSFELVVSDGCGNATSVTVPFEVQDCIVQTPSCIHGLSVELMRTEPGTDVNNDGFEDAGAMTIAATDFLASPISDCSGPVTFSINRVGEEPSPEKTDLIVTCDDKGILPVEIYVWDQGFNPYLIQPDGTKGGPNYDFCETVLYVQDNMFNLCGEPARVSVSGLVTTEEQEAVEEVEMHISGGMNGSVRTPVDGSFNFAGLRLGGDYTITPKLNERFLNGVSTFDIVLISKHILGIQRLDSPYKLIAADVNRSNSISALDIIQLRKMILSIDTRFRNNTSWRFVRTGYRFPDPANPWLESFPELVNYNNLGSVITTADFTAVKVGDVNLNAAANSRMGAGRTLNGETYVDIPLMKVEQGQTFTVPFSLSETGALEGVQFGLRWDVAKAELIDIEYGLAQPAHLGVQWTGEGILLTSWDDLGAAAEKAPLFQLVFSAREDLTTEKVFEIDSRYLSPEAYNNAGDELNLRLRTAGQAVEEAFALYQNRPNPFREATQIQFYLPRAMEATLSIYDVNGRLVRVVNGNYERGLQQLNFSRAELPATGVLYYTLKAGDFTATNKMILIE